MPKLPDYRDVGAAPSANSGRRVRRASEVDFSAVGRGVQRAGKVVGAIGADIQKKNDVKEGLEADALWQKQMNEHNRTYNTDPDYQNYDKRFGVASTAITTDAAKRISNSAMREKFILEKQKRAEQYRHGHLQRATKLEQGHNLAKTESAVQTAYNTYTAPDVSPQEKEHARQDIYTRIDAAEKTGIVTPSAASKLRQKYARDLELGDGTVRAHEKPDRSLKDIEEWEKTKARLRGGAAIGAVKIDNSGVVTVEGLNIKPVINPAAPYMARKRRREVKDIKGIVIHGTKNTDEDGNEIPVGNFVKYGQKVDEKRGFDPGYHFYIDRDGTVIQGTPLNQIANGAKRYNKDQVHVSIIGANDGRPATPEQIRVARGLVSGLGTQLGIKTSKVLGHGEIQGDRHKHEGGGIAAMIRKDGYSTGGDPALAGIKDPDAIARAAELRSRYGNLTPQDLLKLKDIARRRQKVDLEGNRQRFKSMLNDDIASRRATGSGREGLTPDVMADAKKVLTRNQIDTYMEHAKVADGYYKATRDLKDLSNTELTERLAKLSPTSSVGRALNQKIYNDVKKTFDKELKLRKADPALAVENHPAIEAFKENMAANTPEREEDGETGGASQSEIELANLPGLIAARLAAQEDMGIAVPRTITKEEAARILPNIKELNERDRLDALKQSWAEVQRDYGPHAAAVMRDALHYARVGKSIRDEEARGIQRSRALAPEHAQTMADWRSSFTASPEETFMEPGDDFDEAFWGDEESAPDKANAPPAQYKMLRKPASDPGAPAPVPNVAVYQYALEKGEKGARMFDQLYGDGAFAKYSSIYSQHVSRTSAAKHRSQGMPSQ